MMIEVDCRMVGIILPCVEGILCALREQFPQFGEFSRLAVLVKIGIVPGLIRTASGTDIVNRKTFSAFRIAAFDLACRGCTTPQKSFWK